MVVRIVLIFISIIFLVGCAEVGVLTGGDEDIFAPQPISEKVNPENGSHPIYPSEITIPFDEFFKLSKPTETIFLIPNDTDVKAKIQKKTLVLNLGDSLKENTTYVIYMNRAVQDITEGNDSIMKYVFSTGEYIDSLTYQVQVMDAFTNKPMQNILVGLYWSNENDIALKESPRYFASSDEQGIVQFDYLSAGKYSIYAFNDLDRNLKVSRGEMKGFLKTEVELDTTKQNAVPIIRMINSGAEEQTNTSNTYIPSGRWALGFSQAFSDSVRIDNLSSTDVTFVLNDTKDSIVGYFQNVNAGKLKVTIYDGDFADTITKNVPKLVDYKVVVESNLKNEKLAYLDTLTLSFTDLITQIDTTKMRLVQQNDTVPFNVVKTLANEIQVITAFSKDTSKFYFDKESIQFLNGAWQDTTVIKYTQLSAKDVGSIIANLDTLITTPGVLEILKKNKVVQTIRTSPSQSQYIFKNLLPGSYTYRFIIDTDNNGIWSKGNFNSKIEPERVIWFKESSKVRPNWEIEAELKTP